MTNVFFSFIIWTVQFKGCLVRFFISTKNNPIFNVNSADTDQTSRSAASDLGLNCRCPFYGRTGINGIKGLDTLIRVYRHLFQRR